MVWWVWFLQDFHTKKTKTGRQGDRETGRQGDRETRKTENKNAVGTVAEMARRATG